jgi:curli biogenesis system outer membrane secretion channel CsgG
MKHNYLIFLIILLFTAACNPSKSLYKKGKQLETAGMHREAAAYYYDALRYNNRNVDAQIALKVTGQKVLNDYYETFFRSYNTDKLKEAVYAYRDAEKYYNDLNELGVYLKWDDHYKSDYEEARGRYLEVLYQQGLTDLKANDFTAAHKNFAEITSFDPKYKDVPTLKETAKLEPMYQQAIAYMNEKKYAMAYEQLDKICRFTCKYKETEKLKAEALEKATFTIGFFVDDKDSKNREIQRKLASMITDELMQSRNPFIQVVDRENIDKLLQEQKLGMSGMIDEKKAATAGKMLGVQSGLFIHVTENTFTQTGPVKQQRTGFEISTISYRNNMGETVMRRNVDRFTYYEYSASSSYRVSADFKLVSTETGKILYSKAFSDTNSDQIRYAIPSRNIKLNQIYPTQDGIGNVNSFRSMFNSRQQLKSSDQLNEQMLRNVAGTIAYEILQFHKQMSSSQ